MNRESVPRSSRRQRSRGTVLVFVLGMLVLLFFIGFTLLASTRGERQKAIQTKIADNYESILANVTEQILIRLRDDVWNTPSGTTPSLLSDMSAHPRTDAKESNEPFDAPGPWDRWLSATLPFRFWRSGAGFNNELMWSRVSYVGTDIFREDLAVGGPGSRPKLYRSPKANQVVPPGASVPQFPNYDTDPQSYSGASYSTNYPWSFGSKFENVPVWDAGSAYFYVPNTNITPPSYFPPLPHSVTLARARAFWDGDFAQNPAFYAVLKPWRDANPTALFPYFDKDLDGFLDLYDADGDGVPDSPLSFEMTYPGEGPESPRHLYVAVRIIDNSSMLNLNATGVMDSSADGIFQNDPLNAPGPGRDYLNGAQPLTLFPLPAANRRWGDYQLRGRRVTEVTLDPRWNFNTFSNFGSGTIGTSDEISGNYGRPVIVKDMGALVSMLSYRSNGHWIYPFGADPVGYYDHLARSVAIGGATPFETFNVANVDDEAALRGGFILPSRLAATKSMTLPDRVLVPSVERFGTGLPNTLHWTQTWNGNTGRYEPQVSNGPLGRASPFDIRNALLDQSDISVVANPTSGLLGFRELLTGPVISNANPNLPSPIVDGDWANATVRRPLFTTISYDTTRHATGMKLYPAGTPVLPASGIRPPQGTSPWQIGLANTSSVATLPAVYVDLWLPPASGPTNHREKIDLNKPLLELASNNPAANRNAIADYVGELAWAIYEADPEVDVSNSVFQSGAGMMPPTGRNWSGGNDPSTDARRLRRALQIAVNIIDFRDSDDDPTVVVKVSGTGDPNVDPLSIPIVGLEKQPFITEALAFFADDQTASPPLNNASAVELYYPYEADPRRANDAFKAGTFELVWRNQNATGSGLRLVEHRSIDLTIQKAPLYYVIESGGLSQVQTASVPTGNQHALWSTAPLLQFQQDFQWVGLARKLRVPNSPVPMIWIIDRMRFNDTPGDSFVTGDSWQSDPNDPQRYALNVYQRNTDKWRFTTALSHRHSVAGNIPYSPPTGWPTVGHANDAALNTGLNNVVPCNFVFRNPGLDPAQPVAAATGAPPFAPPVGQSDPGRWAFDTLGDISRVMAFGTDWRQSTMAGPIFDLALYAANGGWAPGPGVGTPDVDALIGVEPSTQWLQRAQQDFSTVTGTSTGPYGSSVSLSVRKLGLGHLDWFNDTAPVDRGTGRLALYMGCNLLDSDRINNNRDANTNALTGDGLPPGSVEEARALFFRDAGKINVNTAPAAVLRCVPFMSGVLTSNGVDVARWDFGAEIQAFRERHGVRRVSDAQTTVMITSPEVSFRSLSELAKVGQLANSRGLDLLGTMADVPEHKPTGNLNTPDFDRFLDEQDRLPAGPTATDRAVRSCRERDLLFSRWGNILTTRSDVYTAYVALFDENGNCVRRTMMTLDRSITVGTDPAVVQSGSTVVRVVPPPLPRIVMRRDLPVGGEGQ